MKYLGKAMATIGIWMGPALCLHGPAVVLWMLVGLFCMIATAIVWTSK